MSSTKRSLAALASLVGALAIVAPITTASAATTPAALPAFSLPTFKLPTFNLPAYGGLPAFGGGGFSFVAPALGCVCVAIGPTVIGSVFNGGTTVVVSTGPAAGSVIGSP